MTMFPRQGKWDVDGAKGGFKGTEAEIQEMQNEVNGVRPQTKDWVSAVFEEGDMTDEFIDGYSMAMAFLGLETKH